MEYALRDVYDKVTEEPIKVLILVLMEYALRDLLYPQYLQIMKKVLILVLMEYALRDPQYLQMMKGKVVLILVLMEYALRGQKLKTPCLSVFQDYKFLFLLQTAQKTCLIFAAAKLQNKNNMSKSYFVNTG